MQRLPESQEEILRYLMTSNDLNGGFEFPIVMSDADCFRDTGREVAGRGERTLEIMEKNDLLKELAVGIKYDADFSSVSIIAFQITPEGELYFDKFLKEE